MSIEFQKKMKPAPMYLRFDEDVANEIKRIAVDNQTSIAEVVRKLVAAGLKQYKEDKK